MATLRPLLLLFLVSLAVRLAWAAWLTAAHVPFLYDEADVLALAAGWLDGRWSPTWRWPPLLGLAAAGGALVGVPRLASVLAGALTTPLVVLAARRHLPEAWARGAGVAHVLWPTAVFFAGSLWAESLLGLWALALLVVLPDARSPRHGAGVGLLLGLAGLTKLAAWPWLAAVPLWLWARGRPRVAAVALGVGLVLVGPWSLGAWRATGSPAGVTSGVNLAMGNNPWVPAGLGSSVGHRPSLARLEAELAGGPRSERARALALRTVAGDPGGAVARSATRLRLVWGPDLFPVRHAASATLPPLGLGLGLLWLATWGAWAALLAASVAGSFRREAVLPWVLVGSALVPPLLTVAQTRFHHPWLLLLLPVATLGVARERRVGPWVAGVLVVLLAGTAAPALVRYHLEPSRSSAAVVGPVSAALGVEPVYVDRFIGEGPLPVGCTRARDGDGVVETCPGGAPTGPWRRQESGRTWLGGAGAR